MADAPEISVLFVTIVDWAASHGAKRIRTLPGLWEGETDEWKVKINGHGHMIEDVPAFGYIAQHKTAFLGWAAGDPFGGAIVGPNEDDLIAHFKARTARSTDG